MLADATTKSRCFRGLVPVVVVVSILLMGVAWLLYHWRLQLERRYVFLQGELQQHQKALELSSAVIANLSVYLEAQSQHAESLHQKIDSLDAGQSQLELRQEQLAAQISTHAVTNPAGSTIPASNDSFRSRRRVVTAGICGESPVDASPHIVHQPRSVHSAAHVRLRQPQPDHWAHTQGFHINTHSTTDDVFISRFAQENWIWDVDVHAVFRGAPHP